MTQHSAPPPPEPSWRDLVADRLGLLAIVLTVLSFLPVWLGLDGGTARMAMLMTQAGVLAALGTARAARFTGAAQGVVVVATFLLVGGMGASVVGLLGGPVVAFTLAVVTAGVLGGRRAMLITVAISGATMLCVAAAMVGGYLSAPSPHEILPSTIRPWLRSGSLSLLMITLIGGLVVWVVEHLEQTTIRLAEEGERRRAAERQAHEAQRVQLIGQLAAGLAHDVNNHLNVISMWVGMLTESDGDLDLAEGADAISTSVQQAAMLTQQMLVLGHRGVRKPTQCSVTELLAGIRKTVGRVLPPDIAIELDAPADLWVHADESQLQQVMLNLCMNARDAMPGGGRLVIRAERSASAPPGTGHDRDAQAGWALIEVVDTGVGMDQETVHRATEPFFTTKPRGRGTGLGLATTRSIIEASGGQVALKSAVGEGTTVRLWLPVGEAARPAPASAPPATRSLVGARILVAEDSTLLLRAQVHALTSAGARVVTASNGDEALQRVQEGPFDALCTDAVMPGSSAQLVIDAFAQRNPGAPVLLCSGYVEEELLRRGIEAGEFRFLGKPFTAADLVNVLAEVLLQRAAV